MGLSANSRLNRRYRDLSRAEYEEDDDETKAGGDQDGSNWGLSSKNPLNERYFSSQPDLAAGQQQQGDRRRKGQSGLLFFIIVDV